MEITITLGNIVTFFMSFGVACLIADFASKKDMRLYSPLIVVLFVTAIFVSAVVGSGLDRMMGALS